MDRVSDRMDKRIVAVSPNATVASARMLANNSRVGMLPVVSDRKLVGMIDVNTIPEYDDTKKVSAVMKKPLFVEEGKSIDEARKILIGCGIPRLPVVDSSVGMKCVGTVSSSELL